MLDRLGDAASEPRIGLAWLVRLRWLAAAGQLGATLLSAFVLDVEVDVPVLLALIGASAASNVGLQLVAHRARAPARGLLLAVLMADAAILSAMLAASGGPMNPFSVFFLVDVALAGLLLGARGAWTMAGWTALGFGVLFLVTPEGADPHAAHHHGASVMHLHGMWIAYVLAAGFVAAFVSGIARALRRRVDEVARLRERAHATTRLAAMSAFSAAAAHELGTPLATIAIAAQDLALVPASADDARLIRAEVERCRALLRELAERAGTWAGETPEATTVDAVLAEVKAGLGPPAARVACEVVVAPVGGLVAPLRSLVQSLVNLAKNALDASPSDVRVEARASGDQVAFAVLDRGPGFPPDVAARLGEPFVTTKAPGEGMGLGLHLALAFADKVGGTLAIGARVDGGAEVILTVPRDVLAKVRPAHLPPEVRA